MKKITAFILAACMMLSLTACSSSDYKKAKEYLNDGKYDAAIQMFEDLGDYKDSSDMVLESKYQKAKALFAEASFDEAYTLFGEMKDYSDAADQMNEVKYAQAGLLVSEEKFEEALEIYRALEDYGDSQSRAVEVEEMMKVHATSVALDKTTLSLNVGKTATLTATMEPENTTDVVKEWKSSDESIAKVDESGKVTAVAAGTATITVSTSNGLAADCRITVSKPASTSTPKSANNATAQKSESIQIKLKIPTNGSYNAYCKVTVTNNTSEPIVCPEFIKVNGYPTHNFDCCTVKVGANQSATIEYCTMGTTNFSVEKSMYLDNNSIGEMTINGSGKKYDCEFGVNGIISIDVR